MEHILGSGIAGVQAVLVYFTWR